MLVSSTFLPSSISTCSFGTFYGRPESVIDNSAIISRRSWKPFHVGNYSLFISGIFHENTQRRSLRGGPDIGFYEQIGRTNYQLVAGHATARRCDLTEIYEELASRFRDVRLALNQLSDRLFNLDGDLHPALSL
jgi:hypothetical protein